MLHRRVKYILFTLLITILAGSHLVAAPTASQIVKKCIQKHGGWEKFSNIRDFYAKMLVKTFSEEGEIESTVHQYFRQPDMLRAEIYPSIDPPTKISWDGERAWQYSQGKLEQTNDPRQIERLQDSLRFIKLMILTNLFEKGSKLKYERTIKPKNKPYKFHVISQINSKNETLKLFIHENYTLLGAEFYWDKAEALFKVFFDGHKKYDTLYLPRSIRLYRGNEIVLQALLRDARMNALKNDNEFFSQLSETARMQKKADKKRGGRGRRGS